MQVLNKRKKKKKEKVCVLTIARKDTLRRSVVSNQKRTPKERANYVIGGKTEFVFTTQLGGSQSNGFDTWILDNGASCHMMLSES